MRYKKFQISGAVDLDEIDMLWITDVDIVDGSILQKDRVKEEDLESTGRFKVLYEYIKVGKYLYQRVDAGSNEDADYGQATTYYYVLPETHPSFNFDILYKAGRYDKDIALFTDNDRADEGRTVLHRQLPEFVNRNTYE
jgi:hypothetical protein